MKTLAPLILLETVLQDLRKTMRSEHESEHWIPDSYILEPLRDFGLIEKKDPESRDHEGAEIRITPL